MKIRILHADKHIETIENATSVILSMQNKREAEIVTKSQRTKRAVDDIICLETTGDNGNLLVIDDLNGVNPGTKFDFVSKIFIDKNYGMEKLYVEGFCDEDGKGEFHTITTRVLVSDRIVKGGNLKL